MSSESISFMVQMGFSDDVAKKALSVNGDNLEAAIAWALENNSKTDAPSVVSNDDDETSANFQPKSLRCEDCGKLFKSVEAAELHGLKTQHENFAETTEEIKPLTAEEKKAQADRIQQLIVERRLKRQQDEENAEREREISRRAAAKNLNEIKEQMKLQEIKKAQEDRIREKNEDRIAKQKILEQIAKDKEERRLRLEREKAGAPAVEPVTPVPSQVSQPAKSNAAEARIQIRLSSGGQFTQVFKSSETLAAVRCLVVVKEPSMGNDPTAVTLMCPFMGRKVFSDEDMEKTLAELGLSPSAALIASKK